MAEATVKITVGQNCCQHVTAEITLDGETRSFTFLRDEIINGEQDKERKFQAVLSNIKTNVKLSAETDWEKIKTSIDAKGFKV